MGLDLSIVIPVYNERDNVAPLLDELAAVFQGARWTYEILCVDDRSTDGSYDVLLGLQRRLPQLQIVRLRSHAGQTAALAAGFAHGRGNIVITMDADHQNDPQDIPQLVQVLQQGYDIVSGWRRDRQDAWVRVAPSRIANWILARLTGVPLHDFGCALKAYRREVLEHLVPYGEGMHRIFPAYLAALGCRIREVEVHHRPRRAGRSKYGLNRIWRVVMDILAVAFVIRFSKTPIRMFGGIGAVLWGLGSLIGVYVVARAWWFGGIWVSPLLFVAMTLAIAGSQFIALGLLGEMLLWTRATEPRERTYTLDRDESSEARVPHGQPNA